ncbi:origin recognition complex subunit 4-like [Anoplophora glabripennis]|nr:origin recognition complex subunit 4-like [Anoplophora glabripennis]XP_023312796.1 origin recognition complex subunit 4-like [Anoplophora glabripennis]
MERDDMLQILLDLNVLELCLIISMKHHVEIYDNQPMNFEMVFSRYLKFVNANSNIQSVQRPVIMKAFEHIQNLEIISMISGAGSRNQKEYQFFKLLVTSKQISDALKKYVGLPTEVVQWANSSLV